MSTGNTETFKIEGRKTGKHNCRTARKIKKIPGVIYGPKIDNQNVAVDELFIEKHRSPKYESVIFKTESDDSNLGNLNVMLKEVIYHPVSGRPVHVDFYALDMAEKIKVHVPLKFVGEPVGVKNDGGVVNTILHEIELECSPADIPEEIVVDISHMEINSSLHVSEISIPGSVKLITSQDRTAVTVAQPKEEKAPEVEAAPLEGEAAAVPAAGGKAAPAAPAAAEKKDKK